jgi:hypothetical protein
MREDKECPEHDHEVDVGHSHHAEDPKHDVEDQDGGHDHEYEDVGAVDDGTTMSSVQDPYLQELLLKQTSNGKATA